jgi:hypothetical protein
VACVVGRWSSVVGGQYVSRERGSCKYDVFNERGIARRL